jgi:hypothetical protein
MGPCKHGIAYLLVVDGEDNLQAWKVAVKLLNKQTQTTYEQWSLELVWSLLGS